jgi:hypothetical protein
VAVLLQHRRRYDLSDADPQTEGSERTRRRHRALRAELPITTSRKT